MKRGVVIALLFVAAPRPIFPQATAPPTDFLVFDNVRYHERIESDGRRAWVEEARVLLRDAAAVSVFGQIGKTYVDGYGDVHFEEVTVEKADGRRIDANTNGLIEVVNPFGVTESSGAADIRFKKLTIAGLEPGDRLSYRVAVRSRPLAPGRIFGEMKFAGMVSDPMQVYELDLPRESGVAVELRQELGTTWEEVAGPPDRVIRRLSIRPKRPAAGAHGPTPGDLEALAQPDVLFSNFPSWSAVAEWWWDLAKDRIAPDPAVRAEAARLVAGKTSVQEKLQALHAFVAGRVRYLNVSFGLGRMQPRPAADVLSSRYGDCKDKTTLLTALAASASLDVRPVLIHSGRKTLRDAAPGPQQFDHMIGVARLGPDPKDWLWLDPASDLAPAGYLSSALRDKPALLVDTTGKGQLVRTPAKAPFPQRAAVAIKGALPPEGPLRTHVTWTIRSDAEIAFRAAFRLAQKDRYEQLVKQSLASVAPEAKITNVSVSDPSQVELPFRIEFDLETMPGERSAEREWALSLPWPALELPTVAKDTATEDEVAKFQFDEFEVDAEIALPGGLSGRAPVPVSLDRPFAKLHSDYAVDGSVLRASRRLSFLKPSVSAGESASYESFLKLAQRDHDQTFWIEPMHAPPVKPAPAAAPQDEPESAAALQRRGAAALEKDDFTEAVVAFEKAVALDPKLKDGFNDLGRALRGAGRNDEALDAFGKQIELDPFHDSAYAERARTFQGMNREQEAEKDYVKQTEVAPFKALSYERLGDLRMHQMRAEEAARAYSAAASIEPKNADNWICLGWASFLSQRPKEATAAFQRARALNPQDETAHLLALGLHLTGDLAAAGEIAEAILPRLTKRLVEASSAAFGDADLARTEMITEAWQIVGAAALAKGDVDRAERYLKSAWEGALLPEAAWHLGEIRDRQGRPAEAAALWSAATAIPWAWRPPGDFTARVAAARARAGGAARDDDVLMRFRTMVLPGTPSDDFTEEVLLLIAGDGHVVGARDLSGKNKAAFERVLPQLTEVKAPFVSPETLPVKIVRQALLTCYRPTSCSVVFELPGMPSLLPPSP